MRLLVTGAGGFLGRAVVDAALERGHYVRALLRPASAAVPMRWTGEARIEVVHGDLRVREGLASLLDGIDGVIHLAASKSGDLHEQLGGTVIATENLLDAMVKANVRRLALTSSFAVYEYMRRWSWSRLDEDSPLAQRPGEREEYCQTKLFQERLAREYAARHWWRIAVLRPGVIFGRGNLWSARLGTQAGRWWLCTGLFNRLPLTYVENCAEAVVCGVELEGGNREVVVNVVDESPMALTYLRAVRRSTSSRAFIVPMPWLVIRLLARLAWLANRVLFNGRGKLPGVLVPAKLHARSRPLRYSNERLRRVLDWQPRWSWREGLERSTQPGPSSSSTRARETGCVAAVPVRQAI